MNRFPDYKKATNAAYSELLCYNGHFPSINIFQIVGLDKTITLKTYSQAANYLGLTHNDFAYNYASSEYGFSARNLKKNKSIIFFNEYKSEKTIKFTLAHELGHIRLCHIDDDPVSNKEANCFARNLLCPVPLVDEFGLQTYEDYVQCFDISEPMAMVALEHHSNDYNNISQYNYNKIEELAYTYFTGYSLSELYGFSLY